MIARWVVGPGISTGYGLAMSLIVCRWVFGPGLAMRTEMTGLIACRWVVRAGISMKTTAKVRSSIGRRRSGMIGPTWQVTLLKRSHTNGEQATLSAVVGDSEDAYARK